MHQPIIEQIGLILFFCGFMILFANVTILYYYKRKEIENEMKQLNDKYKKDWY